MVAANVTFKTENETKQYYYVFSTLSMITKSRKCINDV